jgi:hypothetical protein
VLNALKDGNLHSIKDISSSISPKPTDAAVKRHLEKLKGADYVRRTTKPTKTKKEHIDVFIITQEGLDQL